MRKLLLAAAAAVPLIAAATSAAEARHMHHFAAYRGTLHHFAAYRTTWHHQHYGRYLATRHWRYAHRTHLRRRYAAHIARHGGSALPGPCRVAASMGGPCGCWAGYILLGRLDHVWKGVNLWLANDWLRFPRAQAAPGTAAVWPGRHVAPVVAGPHPDGTVTVRDSWAVHRVRMAGLVFVQPPVRAPIRGPLYRYAGAVPL